MNIKMEDVDLEKSDATVEGKCAENQPIAINNFKSKPVKSSTITSASSSVDGEANLRQPQVNGKKSAVNGKREENSITESKKNLISRARCHAVKVPL